ncbi:MAG: hypothetical protein DHS80DRAFT_33699 [Piptocephalis tieghemiana]|nr:MAG: hypothetical protein DHS80DRAFT_33699 [Piptocephalis tieghemiana]
MAPSILLLGGIQQVGRHILAQLVQESPESEIRVVDREHPDRAFLSKVHRDALERIDFLQVNIQNEADAEKAFARKDNLGWDYVINASFDDRYGLDPTVYQRHITQPARLAAQEAKQSGCRAFIHMSYGVAFRYSNDKGLATERELRQPRSHLIKSLSVVQAEKAVQIPGLPVVILRYCEPYGKDLRLGVAAVFPYYIISTHQKQTFSCIHDPMARMNTVHVSDIARAAWHMCRWKGSRSPSGGSVGGSHGSFPSQDGIAEFMGGGGSQTGQGEYPDVHIFNLADEGDSRVGEVFHLAANAFKTDARFPSKMVRYFTSSALRTKTIRESINARYNPLWLEILKKNQVEQTPFMAYIHEEQLFDYALGMDGCRITYVAGFTYQYPRLTQEALQDIMKDWTDRGLLPRPL